jgi:hypothetical protein
MVVDGLENAIYKLVSHLSMPSSYIYHAIQLYLRYSIVIENAHL